MSCIGAATIRRSVRTRPRPCAPLRREMLRVGTIDSSRQTGGRVHAILTVSHKDLPETELRRRLEAKFRDHDPSALADSQTASPDDADTITYACSVPGLILICFRVSDELTQLTVEPRAVTIWSATQTAWRSLAAALAGRKPNLETGEVIETSSDATISSAKSRRERAKDLLGFAQLIVVAIAGVVLVVAGQSDVPSQIAAWLAGVVAIFQLILPLRAQVLAWTTT
jgi:hypothetical protein